MLYDKGPTSNNKYINIFMVNEFIENLKNWKVILLLTVIGGSIKDTTISSYENEPNHTSTLTSGMILKNGKH